jgi:D-alanyl-D-alanine carboxypeptidase
MKLTWQDLIISSVLIFLITLPLFVNSQEYGKTAEKYDFWKIIEGKRLFYPVIKDGKVSLEQGARTAYSVLIDPTGKDDPKVLEDMNADTRMPMASITKLMTAVVVLDSYDLEDEVEIDASDLSVDGNMGALTSGQILSIKDLLAIMLIDSNNGAAEALARKMGRGSFIRDMNRKAALLGMDNTEYLNPSGLDIDGVAKTNTTSAKDLSHLVSHIMVRYPLIPEILSKKTYVVTSKNGVVHRLENTNEMLGEDKRILWGKTGFTDKADGCLVLVSKSDDFSFSRKRYIITVVLGSEDRFEDMRKVREWQDNQFIW